MQSFRTELENPIVAKEIIDLEKKIRQFREGKINEEKFRSLRLTRGVYGQRQPGVQMVRIKLPFGKLTVKQLLRIADISDEYASSNLHLTTRQDIQIHYVSLDRTPELWSKLAADDITLREACGNTVRNITASPDAGINPTEVFDVAPYAYEMFRYFLRNPICQEMGRKFKIAFSSTDEDTGLAFMHDLGFVPKIKVNENGTEERGFKVMVGGGLGAQPMHAHEAFEFLPEDQLIPYAEAVIRVFDRHGERSSRNKARMKYLIAKIGFDAFTELVNQERTALKSKTFKVDRNAVVQPEPAPAFAVPEVEIENKEQYEAWLKTNVFEQKQKGFFAVQLKVLLGDISTEKARQLAPIVQRFAADDIRVTVNQGLLLKFVRPETLPLLFQELDKLGFAEPGFDSTLDVTACPGTDTCNLGISSSTGIAAELERVLKEEYPDLMYNTDIKIKISGCMNSCAQHGMVPIGFHGSSMKVGKNVLPALQLIMGGGVLGDGAGRMGEKVLKIPSRRGLDLVRMILDDYDVNSEEGELFNDYYDRIGGKAYFYALLKPLGDTATVQPSDFIDWGHNEEFHTAIGVGECAGVMIDLVATLLYEAEEKLSWANETFEAGQFADSIYHSYSVFVSTAKALLLDKQVNCNTHNGIIKDFDTHFVAEGPFQFEPNFETHVMQINREEPSEEFARKYRKGAEAFVTAAKAWRGEEVKRPEVLAGILNV
jgi:sulfite reductase (ferredoxin)